MQKLILIPTIISSLRIAILPLFFYLYNSASIIACLVLLAFSAATDFFDGYAARKLRATSKFGAYYDSTTDFALVIGIFTFFTYLGFYPIWLPIIIAVSFIQFVITSHFAKKIYDPVGKYIGSTLYISIFLTLVFPAQATFLFVQYAFIGFFVISILSRIASLARKQSNALI